MPRSQVWCARASYRVIGNRSEVVEAIELAAQCGKFVFLDLAPNRQVALAIKHISAVE